MSKACNNYFSFLLFSISFVYETTGHKIAFSDWSKPKQPDNYKNAEDCVDGNSFKRLWNDNSCGRSLSFVCEWPPTEFCLKGWTQLGDKCYIIPKGKANQATAQGTCKKLGGVLVEPRDKIENKYVLDFVAKHFGRDERFWMGINDKAKEGR